MGSQQLYQYPQLEGEDAIRLVVIQPSADLTAPIRCSIIQTLLLECEDDIADHYVALSYVWGDQTNRRSVEVDGKAALDITASLDEALRHIRNHHKCLRIWADGVCINQNDVEERNKQVRRMGRIYENAAHTIIFLGLATRETE
ncbi:HET-domain-containing protein, partial [Lophium mytilinum]